MYNWSPCLSHFNPFWAGDSTQKGYSWILPKQHSFFQRVSIWNLQYIIYWANVVSCMEVVPPPLLLRFLQLTPIPFWQRRMNLLQTTKGFSKKDHYRERFFSQFVASGVIGCFIQTRWILARQDSTKKFDLGHSKNVGTWCIQGVDLRWHLFPEKIQMLLTGESEFFHPAPSPANLNLNLSLEFNSTTDVNVAYEVIIILTNDENKLS